MVDKILTGIYMYIQNAKYNIITGTPQNYFVKKNRVGKKKSKNDSH